jgi:hypothetical protein
LQDIPVTQASIKRWDGSGINQISKGGNMKRILISVLCIFLLSGCAGTMIAPDSKPDLTPRPDVATLVIIRDSGFGPAVVFSHYLDGKFIGETRGRKYFVTTVKPGSHYVIVETEIRAVASINFQPGKIYYLQEGVIFGLLRFRTSGFWPMKQNDAIEAMKNCTYWEYDPKKGGEDMDAKVYQQTIADYHAEVKRNPEGFKAMLEYKGH